MPGHWQPPAHLLSDIHYLFSGLVLKHESKSPEFVWRSQCSLLGPKLHYLSQEKSNSLHGSTQVVNIHHLGHIHNLGQNTSYIQGSSILYQHASDDQRSTIAGGRKNLSANKSPVRMCT